MSRAFEVIGDDGIEGDVLGYDDGVYGDVLGADAPPPPARVMMRGRPRGNMMRLAPKPNWRHGQLAPGVMTPDEGLVVLPMTPLQNGGVFNSTTTTITWQGQLQKPFRAERLLVSTVRTGTSAVGRLLGQVFVGVDLQGADITSFDVEIVGTPTAFGTRMSLLQAPPGVLIRVPVVVSSSVVGTDSIFASIQFMGRIVH